MPDNQPEGSAKSTSRILESIEQAISSDKLDLPVLPAVARKMRDAAQNLDKGLVDIARIVQSDAVLTAYILQVANSPLFRGAGAAADVLSAINRLGLDITLNLGMSYCLKSLFVTRDKMAKEWHEKLWLQSTQLSAVAAVLAAHLKCFTPDRALLAGLMQDIGALPIIEKLAQYPQAMVLDNTVYLVLQQYAPQVGAHILERWHFESDIITVAGSREQWQRAHDGPADLADLVMVARLHSLMGTARMKKLPHMTDIPAFAKLNAGELTPEYSLLILKQAQQEIQALHKTILAR